MLDFTGVHGRFIKAFNQPTRWYISLQSTNCSASGSDGRSRPLASGHSGSSGINENSLKIQIPDAPDCVGIAGMTKTNTFARSLVKAFFNRFNVDIVGFKFNRDEVNDYD
jgi:hypothetical protein